MTVPKNYFSSLQAAKLLGLSLTSLNSLVDNGVLEAIRTPGGHRHIVKSSLIDYQKINNYPQNYAGDVQNIHADESGKVVIVFTDSVGSFEPVKKIDDKFIKLTSDPVDLLIEAGRIDTIFVDGKLNLLRKIHLNQALKISQIYKIVVYNSEDLGENNHLRQIQHLSFLSVNISNDFLLGYFYR